MSAVAHPEESRPPVAAGPATATARGRLTALDAWRGLTVLLMLLVNNVALDALVPAQLQHAAWGAGLTLTDLVFPWFLFCAGAALPFSAAAARRAGIQGAALLRKQAWRTVQLYLVGCLVTSAAEHRLTLGLGVLQLIALASFFAGLAVNLSVRWRVLLAVGLLVAYDLFLNYFPQPGGAGVFTESANAVKVVNDVLLSPLGLRGLLSVVPTTALVMLGSLAAQSLMVRARGAQWVLLGSGAAMALLGWLWAFHTEFNKAVWTPSYVLYTSGLATLGIFVFYLLADRPRADGTPSPLGRVLAPLTIPGRNALFAYVAPILVKVWILNDWLVSWSGQDLPIRDTLLRLARTHSGLWVGGWLYTLGYIGAVWAALWYLSRRGLIWKL